MKLYVAGLLFCGGDVALITKSHPEWQAGRLNGIGGQIDDGETPEAAMAREWREETGDASAALFWKHFATLSGLDYVVYWYTDVTAWKFNFDNTDRDEPVGWYDSRALPDNIIDNTRWLLEMSKFQNASAWPYAIQEERG